MFIVTLTQDDFGFDMSASSAAMQALHAVKDLGYTPADPWYRSAIEDDGSFTVGIYFPDGTEAFNFVCNWLGVLEFDYNTYIEEI